MFPTPVGGLPLPSERAACIVVVVLYSLLVPVMFYRAWDRRSRTLLLLGTYIAVIDRIVLFTLRTLATRDDGRRLSDGLLKYSQVSFGLGFVAIGNDLVNILRCALVNPTFGHGEEGRWEESPASQTKDAYFEPPKEGELGNPKLRGYLRLYTFIFGLSFLASSVPGTVALAWFAKKNFGNERVAEKLFRMRYASTSVGLLLVLVLMLTASWSRRTQSRVSLKAINMTHSIGFLSVIVAVYRLIVMRHRTPSLDYTGPGSLNSPADKALFYVFHILPEWLAVSLLLCFNTRKIFGTGFWGDYRGEDDGPKAIKRRKDRKARKEARKARRAGTVAGGPTSEEGGSSDKEKVKETSSTVEPV